MGLQRNRTILTVHDCGNLHRLTGWRRAVLRFFWFTWPLSCVRLVTTISEATRQELIKLAGTPPEKVRVVYNCVSPEFSGQPKVFNAERPLILMLGTAPNKNLRRMTEALAGLPCSVELIGRPSPAQADVFARNRVELIARGDVTNEEIVDAYRRCDFLLFASTHEGFGLPIIEAQAVGRPVVTSICSSMAEVAADSACLVDPLEVSSIRAGVQRVIGDPVYRAELVRRGFENQSRFSAEAVAAQYAALYREVVGARISQ
jgi:glycosyltransferase involved in cell wall biosynthesis